MNTSVSSENKPENPQRSSDAENATPVQHKSTEQDNGQPLILRSTSLNNINSFYRRRSAKTYKRRRMSVRKRLSNQFGNANDDSSKTGFTQLQLKKSMKIKRRRSNRRNSETANDADDECCSNGEDDENKALVYYTDPDKKERDLNETVAESDLIFFKRSVKICRSPSPEPSRCSLM